MTTAWIRVNTSHRFKDRLGLAEITRVDFINAGGNSDQFHRLVDLDEFNEGFLRQLLTPIYGSTASWVLLHIQFDPRMNAFTVLACSPDFPLTSPAAEPTRLDRLDID